jgi:hypothetical protein
VSDTTAGNRLPARPERKRQRERKVGAGLTAWGPSSGRLDMYGHLRPDKDESTREAVDAVLSARAEQGRNAEGAR